MLTFAILLLRWHNVIAKRVKKQHLSWSDEDVFQRARRIVIASMQNVIFYEYLPAFLGSELSPYGGYQQDTHPGVSHMFQAAAFRFGHSLIPPGIYRRDGKCNFRTTSMGYPALRLCSTWWDSNVSYQPAGYTHFTVYVIQLIICLLPLQDAIHDIPIEEILMGMSSQIAEREDPLLCQDVRDKLFGPMEFSRRDLGALNIMRGRDNGLPDYNTARAAFKLPMKKDWYEINPEAFDQNPDLMRMLISAYNNRLDNVDVYVGGMLESYGKPGELFTAVIKDQFTRIRDADRFWFENEGNG